MYLLKCNEMPYNYKSIQKLLNRVKAGQSVLHQPEYIYGRADCGEVVFTVSQQQASTVMLHIQNDSDEALKIPTDASMKLCYSSGDRETDVLEEIVVEPGKAKDVALKWRFVQNKDMPIVCLSDIKHEKSEEECYSFDVIFPLAIVDAEPELDERRIYGSDLQEDRLGIIEQNKSPFITFHGNVLGFLGEELTYDIAKITTESGVYESKEYHPFQKKSDREFYITYYFPEYEGEPVHVSNEIFEIELKKQAENSEVFTVQNRYNMRKVPSVEGELIRTLDIGTICQGTGASSEDQSWTEIMTEDGTKGWIVSKALAKTESTEQMGTTESEFFHKDIRDKFTLVYRAACRMNEEDKEILTQNSNIVDMDKIKTYKGFGIQSCIYTEYDSTQDGLDVYKSVFSVKDDNGYVNIMIPTVFKDERVINVFEEECYMQCPNAVEYYLRMNGNDEAADEYIEEYEFYKQKEEFINIYNDKVNEYNQAVDEYNRAVTEFGNNVNNYSATAPSTGNSYVCAICNGTGQQYNPHMYYDVYQGWYGGYTMCGGCAGFGYIG